jgi:hypothetical protein
VLKAKENVVGTNMVYAFDTFFLKSLQKTSTVWKNCVMYIIKILVNCSWSTQVYVEELHKPRKEEKREIDEL